MVRHHSGLQSLSHLARFGVTSICTRDRVWNSLIDAPLREPMEARIPIGHLKASCLEMLFIAWYQTTLLFCLWSLSDRKVEPQSNSYDNFMKLWRTLYSDFIQNFQRILHIECLEKEGSATAASLRCWYESPACSIRHHLLGEAWFLWFKIWLIWRFVHALLRFIASTLQAS
jgi:hypothetical protein